MKIQLTEEEYNFLLQNNFINENLKKNLGNIDSNYNLTIEEEQADAIRDECGEYLQIVGFDKHDNPTPKGIILERLIDKFFIG